MEWTIQNCPQMLFYVTCRHFYRPLKSCDIRFGMEEVQNIKKVEWNVFSWSHFMAKTVFQKSERSAIFGLWPFWRGASKFFPLFWSHMNPGTKIYKISKLQLGKCLLTRDGGVSPVSRTTKYWTLPILTQNPRCIFQTFQQNQEKTKGNV